MKLKLIYPVNMALISQPFGVNEGMYSDPKYGGIKGHNGIDFYALHGCPIYATHDGIAYYEYDGGQGEGVVIKTDKEYEGENGLCYYKTIYWHLCDGIKEPQFISPVYKAVGYHPDMTGISNQGIPVQTGDLIGYADNTGASTGDHLHFGLKPIAKNEANGAWYNMEQQNGYNGAIDPQPFFNGYYPQSISIMKKIIELCKILIASLKANIQTLASR